MKRGMGRWWWAVGLALAALVVIVLAPLASPDPDGLERVAIDQGFASQAQGHPFQILSDYTIPGIEGPVSTILAGLIGVGLLFAVLWLLGRTLARRQRPGTGR